MAKIISVKVYVAECPECGRVIEFEKNELIEKSGTHLNEAYYEATAKCPHCQSKIDMTNAEVKYRNVN